MKIRTQFFISLALFGVMVVIVAVSFFFTAAQTNRLEDQEQRAHNLAQAATELGYLANDYLLNREPQQRVRWETRFAQVAADLEQIDASDPATATLVDNIRANQQSLRTVFNDVANTIQTNPLADAAARLAFTQVSWSRLQVPTQAIVFDAARLPEVFENKGDAARARQFLLLLGILGLILGYFVLNYGLIYRRTLHSIGELQYGAAVVGSGNLDFSIGATYEDEIGDLARAFNKMTANLKTVTASKIDLEKEMVRRAEAEEELHITNEELRIAIENLQENARKLETEMHERAASEERFHGLFQKAPYAVALSSIPDGRYADVNEAFLKMTGFSLNEVIGKNSVELGLFPDQTSRANVVAELKAKNSVHDAEMIILTKSGERCIVSSTIEPITLGGQDYWLAMQMDITDRRKAEESLAQSRERLELALAAADMGTFEWDIINDKRIWDDNTHRLLGVAPGTYDGTAEGFIRVVHPDDQARVRNNLKQAIETSVYNNEYRAVWPDGSIRHIAARGKVYKDSAGKPVRMAAICWDITDEKKAGEALARSNQKVSDILASIQDSFYVLDRDWNFAYANAASAATVGKPPEEFIGHNYWQLFPKSIGTILEENYRAAMERREVRRFESHSNVANIWWRVTVFPSAEGITVLGEDITEFKKSEAALRQSYADLERINRAAVGRELKMVELKKEINKYYIATGQGPRYMIDPDEEK